MSNPTPPEAAVPGGNADTGHSAFQMIAAYAVFFILLWLLAKIPGVRAVIYWLLALTITTMVLVNYKTITNAINPVGGS